MTVDRGAGDDAPPDTNPGPPEGPGWSQAVRTKGATGRLKALVAWWQQTRIARTLQRYGARYGGLMASGMALTTMLSLTAVLTVAITVFMAVLGGNAQLKASFLNALDTALPGILKTDSKSTGLLDPNSLVQSNASSITGVIALLVAAWSAVTLVGNLAKSIQSMFGLVALPGNAVMRIVRNALGAAAMGICLVASSGLSIVVNIFRDWITRALGISPGVGRIGLIVSGLVISAVADAAMLVLLVRAVAGVRVPRKDLWWGVVLFAIGSGLLRQLGTTAVGAVDDALLASATAIITLILWINLLVRVLLYVCAWMANPPQGVPVNDPEAVHFRERPNFVTMSSPATLEWPHNAVTGEVQPVAVEKVSQDQDPLPL